LPDIESDELTHISITTLIEQGIIDEETIINPKTKEEISAFIEIKYEKNYNQYSYVYKEECTNN